MSFPPLSESVRSIASSARVYAEWAASFPQLLALSIADNLLSGSLPLYEEGFPKLRTLNLVNNNISGTIPAGEGIM